MTAVLAAAAAWIGTRESPARSNNTAIGRWYDGGRNTGQPWCAKFVARVWVDAFGVDVRKTITADFASTRAGLAAFRRRGLLVDAKTVRAGDIVYIGSGGVPSHVCIATGPAAAGWVPTIGGNESDQVKRGTKRTRQIVGVARYLTGGHAVIAATTTPTPVPVPKPAKPQPEPQPEPRPQLEDDMPPIYITDMAGQVWRRLGNTIAHISGPALANDVALMKWWKLPYHQVTIHSQAEWDSWASGCRVG